MYLKKDTIVIVEASTTRQLYAPAFIGHGYQCIHVRANRFRDEKLEDYYIRDIACEDSNALPSVLEKLQQYQIKAVIAGCDEGVKIADEIAAHFNLTGNDVKTSALRRDKFLMIDALAKAGLPCASQFCSSSLTDLINWFQTFKSKKVVIKPTRAALTEGVAVCENEDDIKRIYDKYHGKINITGSLNKEFVLQEYLDGKEYIVNSVSSDGLHFITDIWLGIVEDEETISADFYAELVSKKSSEYKILSDYIKNVLDAVGVRNGAAHCEVKLTATGPKLIEINARLAGGIDFSVMQEALGYSQISVAVETILNPDLFEKRIYTYQKLPQKQVRFVYLYSELEGNILKAPDFQPILNLDSLRSLIFLPKPGDYLPRTKEAVGHPGYASLLADNMERIEQDYATFRKLEQQIYEACLV